MHRLCRTGAILLAIAATGFGVGEEKAEAPAVTKIGESRFRLGEIEFDSRTREIFVPVEINQREGGPLEYVLVSEIGKVHESILVTGASPMHLQIALKLLRYEAGAGELFARLLPAEDRVIQGGQSEEAGTEVDLIVRWTSQGELRSAFIHEWVIDGSTIQFEGDPGEPMQEHPWNYTGSMVQNGRILAEIEGSIIAIYLDPVALFNTGVPGSETDERWGANSEAIPEIGTDATLLIRPRHN